MQKILAADAIDWISERTAAFAGAERVVQFEIQEIIDNPAGLPSPARF
jgi:hypothetical protein